MLIKDLGLSLEDVKDITIKQAQILINEDQKAKEEKRKILEKRIETNIKNLTVTYDLGSDIYG